MPHWLREEFSTRSGEARVSVQDPSSDAPEELFKHKSGFIQGGSVKNPKRNAQLLWEELIDRLSENVDEFVYSWAGQDPDGVWAEMIRHFLVLKNDEAVGWYDLDGGLVEFATLYDVGLVTEPKIVKKRKLFLMTESRWVEGNYPTVVGGRTTSKEAEEANADIAEADSASAICMGRQVEIDLIGGKTIVAPKRAGMLYDSSGDEWPNCSLLIAAFSQGRHRDSSSGGKDYFGKKAEVFAGDCKTPPVSLASWRKVGEVEAVFYSRAGTKAPGDFEHQFHKPRGLWRLIFPFKSASKKPVILYKLGKALRLELPEGCMVDDRGIILP